MSIVITTTLNPAQEAQIRSLDASFPVDDVDLFIFWQADDSIPSAAALIQEDETCYECYAFTAPAFRRRGLFTELLDTAIDELPENAEFLFYTNGENSDCLAALKALNAELVLEEHMMELQLSKWPRSNLEDVNQNFDSAPAGKSQGQSREALTAQFTDIDGTRTIRYQNTYGTVNISVFSSYYYLYGFEIVETFRGKGHGKGFLHRVLNDLAARNPLPLRLQVSGENMPALSLYKKTGFQITETLFGYLY